MERAQTGRVSRGENPERNYGVDLLKILAMLMVICSHLIAHGGCLGATEPLSAHDAALNLLYVLSLFGVNVYVMLTGYLYWNRRTKAETLIGLWLVAAFYSVLVPVVLRAAGEEIGTKEIVKGFFPVMTVQSWFFTDYFGLFFLIPALNRAAADRRLALPTLAGAVFCFSLLPAAAHNYDLFGLGGGYTLLWFLVLYLCGACLGRFGAPAWLTRRRAALLFALCVLLTFFTNAALYLLRDTPIGALWPRTFFYNYTSPLILLGAACLVCLFSRAELRAGPVRGMLPKLAARTFGVYLIHDNVFVRGSLIGGRFAVLTEKPVPLMLLLLLASVLGVFALGAALDWLRDRLFRVLGVRRLTEKLVGRVTAYLH